MESRSRTAFSLAMSWSFLYSHASCNPSCSNFHLILPRQAIAPAITLAKSSTVQAILDSETDLWINLFSYELIAESVRICICIFHFKIDFQGLFYSIDFHHCLLKYKVYSASEVKVKALMTNTRGVFRNLSEISEIESFVKIINF